MLVQGIPLPKDILRPVETILINVMPQETRVALLEEDRLVELHIERSKSSGMVGNIYLGKVKRVLPGMQSAFIDIGLEKAAFLHFIDLVENRIDLEKGHRVEHLLFEGQSILVQVIKDPVGNKGPRVTTQISLVGRFLVYLPQDNHIGISQRIEDKKVRERLKFNLMSILPENFHGGLIIRTQAENAIGEEFYSDVDYLTKLWVVIRQQAGISRPRSLIYRDLTLPFRVLRDMIGDVTEKVLVDSKIIFQELKEFASLYTHQALDKIFHYDEYQPMFDLFPLESEIQNALQPRVNLKFGSYLIIESTESMTTIDVNTGGFVGKYNFEETVFITNLEACHQIARELRLRNIGGIIIIDFIDMEEEAHKDVILEELAIALSLDRTKISLNGFTNLGLVELTRKRTRESLSNALMDKCLSCFGKGMIRSIETICYEIMRRVVKETKLFGYQSVKILASQDVVETLIDEESSSLDTVAEYLGVNILLLVDTNYSREEFDIIGMGI